MEKILYIGQWQGFFQYGPEYGEFIEGKEVEFRLFIEKLDKGQFSGRVIDWEGVGAEGEEASIEGFVEGSFISFRKQYPHLLLIDPWGNTINQIDSPGHTVIYEGNYNHQDKCFYGSWQISFDIMQVGEFLVEELNNGTWRMSCNN
jgi:hypothetical protein